MPLKDFHCPPCDTWERDYLMGVLTDPPNCPECGKPMPLAMTSFGLAGFRVMGHSYKNGYNARKGDKN